MRSRDRGIRALENALAVRRVEHRALGDPVGHLAEGGLHGLDLRAEGGEVRPVLLEDPGGEEADLRVVGRRGLLQPRDEPCRPRCAGTGVDAVEPEAAHARRDEVDSGADDTLGDRHRVHPCLTTDPVQVERGVRPDLVALADEEHAEASILLIQLREGLRQREVPRLEQLEGEPRAGQQDRREREERQRRHTSLYSAAAPRAGDFGGVRRDVVFVTLAPTDAGLWVPVP